MKRGFFLYVVVAFSVFSFYSLYLDYSQDCGSLPCLTKYLSTGEVKYVQSNELPDSLISEIIYPFVSSNKRGILFSPNVQPGDGPVGGETEVPVAPYGLTYEVFSGDHINLNWIDASNNEEGFRIERRISGSADFEVVGSVGIDENTFLDSNGLTPGTEYNYRVYAYNSIGNSPPSNEVTAITLGSNVIISSVSPNVIYNNVDSELTLIGAEFGPHFYINIRPEGTTSWNSFCVSGGTNCFYDSSNNVRFFVRAPFNVGRYEVQYVNAYGSYESNPISFEVIAQGQSPTTPQNLVASVLSSTSIGLNWDDVSTNEDGFRIERSLNGQGGFGMVGSVGQGITSFVDNNLNPETNYYYVVYAYNGVGSSPPSNMVSKTTYPDSPVISSLSPSPVSHNVDRTITLSGSGFYNQFAIEFRAVGGSQVVSYCDYINWNNANHNCQRVNSNTFTFVLPQGTPPGNYEFRYVNIFFDEGVPVVQYSGFRPLTVQATTCLDGVMNSNNPFCTNQQGICFGSRQRCVGGVYEPCNTATYTAYDSRYVTSETGLSLCADGIDNDCDENVDGRDYIGSGNGAVKGDSGCPIQITSISAPSSITSSTDFSLSCTTSPGNVGVAVAGTLDGVACTSTGGGANLASFNCRSSSTSGITQVARCDIKTSIGHLSPPARTSNIIITPNSCAGYSESECSSAFGGSACIWCPGCSPSSSQSRTGGSACVPIASGCVYSCNSGQCGATASCSATSGCQPWQTCDTNACGCIEQTPSVLSITPSIFEWSADNVITITGNNFASNSVLLVNGNPTDVSRLNRNGVNSLVYNYLSEEFDVGANQLVVRNPSGLTSPPVSFTLTSNPVIDELNPNAVLNSVNNVVDIVGSDFDPDADVLADGVDISSLTNWVNSGLIKINLIPSNLLGDFAISVRSGDGLVTSPSRNLRINVPFDYQMEANGSVISMNSSERFETYIAIRSSPYMFQESVTLTPQVPTGLSVNFKAGNSCIPDVALTPVNCKLYFDVVTNNLAIGEHKLVFDGISLDNSIVHQLEINVNVTSISGPNCGNNICEAGESCSSCSQDCGSCSSSSGGGSSGGGGGGGGGGSPPKKVLQQCEDGKDNDGDGLIDYPADKGCSNLLDNTELDLPELVKSNFTIGDDESKDNQVDEKEFELRLVFWIVFLSLVAGIVVVSVFILKSLMRRRKFEELAKSINSSSNNSVPLDNSTYSNNSSGL